MPSAIAPKQGVFARESTDYRVVFTVLDDPPIAESVEKASLMRTLQGDVIEIFASYLT